MVVLVLYNNSLSIGPLTRVLYLSATARHSTARNLECIH